MKMSSREAFPAVRSSYSEHPKPRGGRPSAMRHAALWAAGVVLCLASLLVSCAFGPLGFAARDALAVFHALCSGVPLPESVTAIMPGGQSQALDGETLLLVLRDMRLPRAALAFLSGAGLAVAGAVFQAILRNPLADPFTLGVSGGAAFGAALAISLGLTGAAYGFGLPLAAFGGAAAALACVLLLGRIGGGLRHETLILAGVVVSAFLAALIALVKALDESSVTGIVFWIMGSFQGRGVRELVLLLPGFCAGTGLALLLFRELDILSVGDRAARHMGLSAGRARLVLLLAAGAVTASCVAVSGIIGFVGLIVPHLTRMLLGAGHRRLLPASALGGGLLLLWSDTAARSMLPGGVELPVGVITALLGGPFFCWILGKKEALPGVVKDRLPPVTAGETAGEPVVSAPARRPALPLAAEALCAGYQSRGGERADVLRGVTLTLAPGDFAGLLGPNGSGKSTLLQCLSGILPASRGSVHIGGQEAARLRDKERARRIACLPQHPEAVPSLSAFSLVLMGRYAWTPFLGGYGPEDRRLAMASLAEAGAAHLAARPADSLSGGELQRVLLARSLAQDTGLLLLDEATSGLDPSCQAAVLRALERRNRETGLTVLAAMHDLNVAALYCRRLILLKDGRVVADGPTGEVFTEALLGEVYESPFRVVRHPVYGVPQALQG